jgi:hypothetical protein
LRHTLARSPIWHPCGCSTQAFANAWSGRSLDLNGHTRPAITLQEKIDLGAILGSIAAVLRVNLE